MLQKTVPVLQHCALMSLSLHAARLNRQANALLMLLHSQDSRRAKLRRSHKLVACCKEQPGPSWRMQGRCLHNVVLDLLTLRMSTACTPIATHIHSIGMQAMRVYV